MNDYQKPVVAVLDGTAEGVYAASGDNGGNDGETKEKCRFGRSEANPGADTCQSCSFTGGVSGDRKGTYKKDYTGCIDGMPEKK